MPLLMMGEKDNILDLIEGHTNNKDSVQFKLKRATNLDCYT